MEVKKVLTAGQQRFSAQIFNIASIVAVVIPPLLMIWIAVSIFVYASIAYHPNPKVVKYNRWGGYRFYGVAGFLIPFGQPIYGYFKGWEGVLAIWILLLVVVVPGGIWDIIRAQRDKWEDMVVEVEVNA